jgi:fructokinase
MVLGALEAGGTKMVCAIGDEFGNVIDRISLPTKEPENTIPEILEYFASHKVEAVGIGCFGPIDPVKGSATYGRILATPKLAWQNYDIVGVFEKALGCPIGFDTDVNASCLGEVSYGESKGLEHCLYMTVGTGVGVGMWLNGKLYHGIAHAEAGHMKLERHPEDTFEGSCPIHGACLEGLAAGPAVEKRWGAKGAALADRKEVWELEAYYIAQACMNLTLTVAPQRIILGGGVMKQEQLFPLVREKVAGYLNGYLKTDELADLDAYIVPNSLNENQGILGCVELGRRALEG